MLLDKAADFLAEFSGNYSMALFDSRGLGEDVKKCLEATKSNNKRKCRLTANLIVHLCIAMALYRTQSIVNVLQSMVAMLRPLEPMAWLFRVSDSAIVNARQRLGWGALKLLFETRAAEIKKRFTFHGLNVFAGDGVRFVLPDSPEIERAFGRPTPSRGATAFPQMLAVCLVDIGQRMIRAIQVGRCDSSERGLLQKLMAHLTDKDLVLLDRGFGACWLYKMFLDQSTSFLVRILSTCKPKILRELGKGDYLVLLIGRIPLPEDQQTPSRKTVEVRLVLRMLVYALERNKPPVRLLTNLTDTIRFPAREIAQLYHERWDCEMVYDEIKTHFATVQHGSLHSVFRSKSPDGIRQELYALCVSYNLVREILADAADECNALPGNISFVNALNVIRYTVFLTQAGLPLEKALQHLLLEIGRCEMSQPRRPRQCERRVKVKMSKYHLKRPEHRSVTLSAPLQPELTENPPPSSPARRAAARP